MKDVEAILTSCIVPFAESKNKPGLWYREMRDTTEFVDLRDGVSVYMANKKEPTANLKRIKARLKTIADGENQTRLPNKYSMEEEKTDNSPPSPSKLKRWVDKEVKPLIDKLEEIDEYKYGKYKRNIFNLSCTPLHYFEEEEESITPSQANYLETLCDSARQWAYAYLNQHEELPRGEYEEVIPQLTKTQAGDFISYMKGETDVSGKVIE